MAQAGLLLGLALGRLTGLVWVCRAVAEGRVTCVTLMQQLPPQPGLQDLMLVPVLALALAPGSTLASRHLLQPLAIMPRHLLWAQRLHA